MHPVLFYLSAVAVMAVSSGIGLFFVNQEYSRQNMYPDPEKSENDSKNYKIFTLPNQIHVMMITSNITEKSAMSIKSETGFMIDPKNFQGMCNYLLNLLQTSAKYPTDDLIRKYLLINSGIEQRSCNELESSYYLEIQNNAFYSAMDLISHLFVSPLITKQSMDRTLQNMHLIWKNKESSSQYIVQLVAKPKHPLSTFYSGNLQTLFEEPETKELNPYIEAVKFFRAKYSANRLSIVIYTNEDMKKRVTELLFEYFSEVIDKQLTSPTFKQYGMPLKNQRFFFVQHPYRELRLIYDFDVDNNLETNSLQFIIDLIMNELEFCQIQYSQDRVYNCEYTLKEIPKEFGLLEIKLELNQIVKIDDIIKDFYARVNYVKNSKNLETKWQELNKLQEFRVNNTEMDIKNVNKFSSILKSQFSKDILRNSIYKKYDQEHIKFLVEQLNPINLTIVYMDNFYNEYNIDQKSQLKTTFIQIQQEEESIKQKKVRKVYIGKVKKRVKKYLNEEEQEDEPEEKKQEDDEQQGEEEEEFEEIEQVIQTPYDYELSKDIKVPQSKEFSFNSLFGLYYFESGISANTQKDLLSISSSVEFRKLPPIPSDLEIVEVIEEVPIKSKKRQFKYPDLLSSSTAGNLWHVYDTTNNVAKVVLRILVRMIDFQNNDENYVALQILKLNFNKQISYLGSVQMTVSESQFEIFVTCYSSQLNQVAKEVSDNLQAAYKLDKRYEWLLQNLKHQQFKREQNQMNLVISKLKSLLQTTCKLKDLKQSEVQQRLDKIKIKQRWDVLLYGNINAADAKKVYQSILPKAQQGSKEFYQEEVLKLTKRPIAFRLAMLKGTSVVTLNLYQGSENSLAQFVYFKVLIQLMKVQIEDYLFNQLQLGFKVEVQLLTINHIESIAISVQSSNYDPEEVDFYIEESLGYFESYLNKFSERDFSVLKQSLQKEFQNIPYTLDQQADLVWNQIQNGQYYFTLRECTIIALDKITKSELIKFFLIHFKARNSKLSLQVYREGQNIPKEILREQDTFAHKISELVTSEDELKNLIKDTYKFKSKYITEAPPRIC